MSGIWLPWAIKHDLSGSRGNGPFPNNQPKGVVLHVNASGKGNPGTPASWYIAGGGSDSVCPTFQMMRDANATTYQFLPLNWQPWTQRDGNNWGPSIETGGDPSEALTPLMIQKCALIMKAMHDNFNVPLQVTDSPSRGGLGTHGMGGAAWGGHTGCPGTIRSAQRAAIIKAAQPQQDLLGEIMALDRNSADYKAFMADVQHYAGVGVFDHAMKNELNKDAKFSAFVTNDHDRLIDIQTRLAALKTELDAVAAKVAAPVKK